MFHCSFFSFDEESLFVYRLKFRFSFPKKRFGEFNLFIICNLCLVIKYLSTNRENKLLNFYLNMKLFEWKLKIVFQKYPY